MLSYYLQWHLERAWAPLLFRDEDRPELDDVVVRAQRSAAALNKASTQVTETGTPVHSLRTLLAEMSTLKRNRMTTGDGGAEFDLVATPTALQAQALALLDLTLQAV